MYQGPINLALESQIMAQGDISLESMFFYDFFYKRFGIRKAQHLTTPIMPNLEDLDLPRKSIYHHVSMSPLDSGPASDEFMFRHINRPIQMAHITTNGDSKGVPRRLTVAVDTLIRQYHIKHRRYKPMRNLEMATRDQNTLLVYNYGFIPQLYHYARSFYSEYYKWWNIQSSVWKTIGDVAKQNDRQHFIVCKLPTVLPSVSDLNIGSGAISQKVIKIFNTPESLMILELWKWFGAQRKDSVINHVAEDQLNKVNIIFQESGRWFVMNLGLLNSWRQATEEELAANPKANTKGLDARQFQRRFLRMTMSLFQVRTVAAPEVEAAIDGKKGVEDAKKLVENTVQVVKQDPVIPKDNGSGVISTPSTTTKLPTEAMKGHDLDTPDDTADDIKHDDEFEAQLTKDLAELETISKNHVGPHEGEKQEIVIEDARTPESGVMKVCDRLADQGLLSAAQYRHYQQLSQSYKTITAPDGKSHLGEFATIEPHLLKIESSPAIKDIKTVIDKTMLKSSLHAFDTHYIKKVMDRDVSGMVLNLQNAGIAITGYEKERVEDVMGAYDDYTIRCTPVEGAASTFRFKLPALEEDGTYMANGIKYRMRKQRGD